MVLHRELYIEADKPDTSKWLNCGYIDAALGREEIFRESQADDDYRDWMRRVSDDNGRTWSEYEIIPGVIDQRPEGGIVTYPSTTEIHPHTGAAYRPVMKRFWPGNPVFTFDWKTGRHPLYDHVFMQVDNGPPRLLRYEDGPDYDPDNPFDEKFFLSNQSYYGISTDFAADGTAFHPIICRQGKAKDRLLSAGLVLMRCGAKEKEWQASNTVYAMPETSSRGLLEPDVAVLVDGRILVICRGSNTEATPGRKWMVVSDDAGCTLQPVTELYYDDGSSFYSPSSFHRLIRSSRNGRLYWFANITPEPPNGNWPRHPLIVAEIDEEQIAVKKNSIQVVDERGDEEPEALQLSNFSIFENRETLDFEIYMTRLGEDADDPQRAGVYRYIFSP